MNRRAARRRREPIPHPDPVTITGIAEGGKGVARVDGKTVFVAGALTGEKLMISISRRHARYDEAVIDEILLASEQRQTPPCEFFDRCGGCSLQYQLPAGQIADKQAIVMDQLSRIGRVEPAEAAPPLVGESWGYRGKARLGVRYVETKQRLLVGFREKHHNGIADMDRCPVLDPQVSALLAPLARMIEQLSVRLRLPQIEVSADANTVVLVFRHLDPLTDNDRHLLREFGDTHSTRIMLQPAKADSIHPLPPDSADPLSYKLPDEQIELKFLPHQFIQVNHQMNRQMVTQAMDWLAVQSVDRVADLFCGLGNFTLPLARRADRVVGVEGEADLVRQGRSNAELNKLTNVEFRQHDLFTELGNHLGRFDKILLDPPRGGAQLICDHIDQLQPGRILYVSCNPATLARDAGILCNQKNYRLERIGVVDMFPHTGHVESMAVFQRN